MKSRMSIAARAAIRRLAAEAEQQPEGSATQQAAHATGALPVHTDIGGALAVTPDGEVVLYDFEKGVASVPEEHWRIYALAKAARRYPELRELAPPRPHDAVTCPSCGGFGFVLESLECGPCLGLGWTRRE
jgi:hypothetical protein